ncbi:multidrug ABC transporter ATP-binding protein [Ammoniphilus oxalaticus]|uniref:Multidrug ABC transporter ATP-binding protein n=1 Tax=Ammoniphilus oxalaticus TaxID=66863 RepID=A0A419SLZ9_9BACL|nr:ABC transporter ATP-binding protein [Ammoniphilus oxalaticus]RKD25100.1 multidrug ABC transporter ATP-binding protein [Ammoniphilus oxalaticus]
MDSYENILQVSDLIGGYSRRHPILHELTFHVAPGEVVGLVGLNGAGKSTTIKHILGLLEPIQGEILIKGQTRRTSKERYHTALSYVPETPLLYEQLTLWEHMEFMALSYQLDRAELNQRATELMEQFNMKKMKDWLPERFSKGMKQKVMIMNALLAQPAMYIIDEPFVGLDPQAIHALLEQLKMEKQRGAGIFMSTHILATVEHFCDRFILLHEGRILLQGTLSDWRKQTGLAEASLDEIFMTVTEVDRHES